MTATAYHFGLNIPAGICASLDSLALLRAPSRSAELPGFQKDAFYADGRPVTKEENVIYPAMIHTIINIPVPDQLEQIPVSYSRTAACAALKWLEKTLGLTNHHWDLNALRFTQNVNGIPLEFCFQDTCAERFTGSNTEISAALAFPDVTENDDDWNSGWVPQYADAQAQLLLWCHKQYSIQNPGFKPASKAHLVRIVGNLPSDCTVRTVHFDAAKATRIVNRIAAAIGANGTASDRTSSYLAIHKQDWKTRKENELASAYHTEDSDLYMLLSNYMRARSIRKTIEQEVDRLKARRSTIAITLASQITGDAKQGVLDTVSDVQYTVTHTLKRAGTRRISADLVRQFFPEYEGCIQTSAETGRRMTIEVL